MKPSLSSAPWDDSEEVGKSPEERERERAFREYFKKLAEEFDEPWRKWREMYRKP